ncbi:hypothetical protein AUC68_13370 [Methyloceanibacter methanicus]|uniref:Uncharacterized protein n=1 Tax=Methyloceanibacter methanicus TaxID=1774968 RepID=A0A1E3W574_9HYPH|nr:hypothetical protein [Methyloceanibacter methanicus]ODS00916.1 hypothetical protein AUC68_13370 [Methyloceanibacter methanicus]
MTKLRPIAVMLVVLGFALPTGTAGAEPLEADECKALKSEKEALLTATVQAALKRGPDWVKDHLHDQDKIEQVRQYLLVEEKVAFRCRTNGVRIPKPLPPSLPDRKPKVPTFVLAGVDATSLIPLRNPSRGAGEKVTAASPRATARAISTAIRISGPTTRRSLRPQPIPASPAPKPVSAPPARRSPKKRRQSGRG